MATVKLIASDPRDLLLPDSGTPITVAPGDTFETTDEHAKSLARQADNWEVVEDKKPAASKSTKDKE